MNKVICDICGTAYPETATQCPICGSAKQVGSSSSADSVAAPAARQATKGGRFSSSNVKKRNRVNASANPAKQQPKEEASVNESKGGSVAVAWIILIIINLILAYIIIQFILPMFKPAKTASSNKATVSTTVAAEQSTENTTVEESGVACTDLVVAGEETISFDAVGRAWLIEVTAEPENTTDAIQFASSDESVATVDAQGRVTAVGAGNAVITITCGSVTKECNVVCVTGAEETVPEETTAATTAPTEETEATVETTEAPTETTAAPTEATTEPPEETTAPAEENFGLFRGPYFNSDATLSFKGESFEFVTRSGVSLSDITWTSANPAIAAVENGVVTAMAPGETVIYGTYNGEKDSFTIRCAFEGEVPEDPENPDVPVDDDHPDWPYLYPNTEVMIGIDESFELIYVNADGEVVDVDWSTGDSSVAEVDGSWVVGVGYGDTWVRATYDGTEISCHVIVEKYYG